MGKIFSENLKEERLRRNWSQDFLAEKLHITRTALSNFENGKRSPKSDLLEAIAEIFNVSIDYLLGREIKPASIERESIAQIIQNEDCVHIILPTPKTDMDADKMKQTVDNIIEIYRNKQL